MASINSSSKFKPCLILLLVSCSCLIQTCYAAASYNSLLNTSKNKKGSDFDWNDQKTWLPSDPLKCTQSFRQAGVCLMDFWTNFGLPSKACCEALKNIDSNCWPALLPLINPLIGHFLGGLCNFASGGAFPFPPFTPSASPPPPPSTPGSTSGAAPSPSDEEYQC